MTAWYPLIGAIGSIATAGTLIVSLVLIHRQVTAERYEQATKIAAWTHRLAQGEEWVELSVRARNASTLPAYLVIIRVDVGNSGAFWRHLDTLAPNETREVIIYLPGFPRSSMVEPELGFTDCRGQMWKRTRGQLAKATYEDIGNLQQGHPGAYPSEEDHPTLRLPENMDRGHTVDQASR